MIRWLAFALALLPAPAWASSVPPIELAPGRTLVEIGVADLNVDHAVGDRLSLGVNASFFQDTLALRASYRLGGDPGGSAWGLTLGAGYSSTGLLSSLGNRPPVSSSLAATDPYGYQDPPDAFWLSPALVWTGSLPLSRTSKDALTLRGSLGPSLNLQVDTRRGGLAYDLGLLLSPSLELAIGTPGQFEVMAGGNGILGVRFGF